MIEYTTLSEDNIKAVCALSNRNLELDKVSPAVFRDETFGDPDFDPAMAFVATSDGKPCGLMVAVCRNTDDGIIAGIKIFAVDQEFRNQGIASEMLRRVEGEAKARKATSLIIAYTRPNYMTPGLDPHYTLATSFVYLRGFEKCGESYNMDVELSKSDWSTVELEEKLAKDGVVCRRLRVEETERLVDWITEQGYRAGWQYQTTKAAGKKPAAVFIAEKADEILGFAAYDGLRPGYLGPMATAKNLRGGGIGSVTYLKCLQSMKEVGYKVCHINAVSPLAFYSKASNAKVSRIFWHWKKML